MVGIGILGYGYWGPNLVRNFLETPGFHVVAVADRNPARLAQVQQRLPGVITTSDEREVWENPQVDAVAIATPVSTHFELAMQCLRAGKHVLVEKPLAATPEHAARLVEEAAQRKLTLMVDHTFVYTPAVQKLKQLISDGSVGETYYYDSVRINLGLFQSDVDVLWDLAVHDLSIIEDIFPDKPVAISAQGLSHVPRGMVDMAYLTLFFSTQMIAHLHVNWLAPVKVRRTLIGGSRKMIVYDELEPSEKIKVYDKGITIDDNPESVHQRRIGYRSGDMWAPQLATTEALRTATAHFLDCIRTGRTPTTDGAAGLRVVRMLEAASRSLQQRGNVVELER
ncbi:MAG: Gfo/Idh/MocA family oxidoreductase [Myxococcota bacterium]